MKNKIIAIVSILIMVGLIGGIFALFNADNSTGSGSSGGAVHEHKFKITKNLEDCNSGGFLVKECTVCHYSETTTIEPSGHNSIAETDIPATCTEPGYLYYEYCTNCDYKCFEITDEALGHDITVTAGLEATCTSDGYTASETCSRCNYKVSSEVIKAFGHDFSVTKGVSATCTDAGSTDSMRCTRCNYAVESTVIPALGHNLKQHSGREASCLEGGYSEYSYCTRCDYESGKTVFEALGHNFEKIIESAATCSSPLTYYWQCSRCDVHTDVLKDDNIGHLDLVTTTVDSTCSSSGRLTINCSVCGYSSVEFIAKKAHSYVNDICTVCGYDNTSGQTLTLVNSNNTSESFVFTMPSGMTWSGLLNSSYREGDATLYLSNNIVYIKTSQGSYEVENLIDLNSEIASGKYYFDGYAIYTIKAGMYDWNLNYSYSNNVVFADFNNLVTFGSSYVESFYVTTTGLLSMKFVGKDLEIFGRNGKWEDGEVARYCPLIFLGDIQTENKAFYNWIMENTVKR